jgi:hypothetical protein
MILVSPVRKAGKVSVTWGTLPGGAYLRARLAHGA